MNVFQTVTKTRNANILIVMWLLTQLILYLRRKMLSTRPRNAVHESRKKQESWSQDIQNILRLFRVCFPTWYCKESRIFMFFAGTLFMRTVLTLLTAEAEGYMVKSLITRHRRNIAIAVVGWLAIGIPASAVNAGIGYCRGRLSIALRARIDAHIQKLYFSHDAFYRVSHHLVEGVGEATGPRSVVQYPPNTAHAITEAISQWAERCADVMTSVGKPLLDLVVIIVVLSRTLGWRSQAVANIIVYESGRLLSAVRPNFRRIVQDHAQLEGRLRSQYSRIIQHAEEISLYRGEQRESAILTQNLRALFSYESTINVQRGVYTFLEDIVTKYAWTVVGLVQLAVPMISRGASAGDNARFFISVKKIMGRGGDATERLMQGIKDIGELAGHTRNIVGTMDLLQHVSDTVPTALSTDRVSDDDEIFVEGLPLTTPAGDVLIERMNLRLSRSTRLLILGPNGCGKSTLFRILCGLWPARGGVVRKPSSRMDLLFIPQRPFMFDGTLLEQVVYPMTLEEAEDHRKAVHPNSVSLEVLVTDILAMVCMPLGLSVMEFRNWGESLSSGEKQRLGVSRVFFHRPKYAILDEVNSTLDDSSEKVVFDNLVRLPEMGLITISHRRTLFKYHTEILTYDGMGGYSLRRADTSEVTQLESIVDEKVRIATELHQILREMGCDWPSTDPTITASE